MSKTFNIIGKPKSGLGVDTSVIFDALAGYSKARICRPQPGYLQSLYLQGVPKIFGGLLPGLLAGANIFLQRIYPKWLAASEFNILIPNQEWCNEETLALLDNMDIILCKTRYAEQIFKNMGSNATYIGFTSPDRFNPSIDKNFNKFLHVAGQSLQKGTLTLASVWSSHPEWPVLHIVTRKPEHIAQYAGLKNICILESLTDCELARLQNECGVHLCPSEAEGFGHYIAEGLGCGAVVVTTDAPPMNELVMKERGVLVPYAKTSFQSLGTNYYVDAIRLESALSKILITNHGELAGLGVAAREWFLAEKAAFAYRMEQALACMREPKVSLEREGLRSRLD